MQPLDLEIEKIVAAARRATVAVSRLLPTREDQLRMEFALSLVDFLPSGTNLLTYDLASNPHLPFVLTEDEPWKIALYAGEHGDLDTLRRELPRLRIDRSISHCDITPTWAAA